MSKTDKKQALIITPTFRVSYPAVFESRHNELAKRDEFSIVMLFDKKTAKTDLVAMKLLCKNVAAEKWPKGVPASLKNPFRDGDIEKPDNPSYAGIIFVKAWSKYMPGLVNAKKEPIINQDEFYGGCYARAQLNAYAYDKAGNCGISFGLMHVQKVRDGEPFGTRTRAEDAFAPVEGEESVAEEVSGTPKGMFD